MLFHITWEDHTNNSEADVRRRLEVFGSWQPPEGAKFLSFYGFASGGGGVAIVEVDDAATLARTTAPFTPWMRFTATPILPIEQTAAISGEAFAFLATIQG